MNTTTLTNQSRLKEMLKSAFEPALQEGEYKVKLMKYALVEDPEKHADYVRFEFKQNDTGRVLVENRFEKGLGVMISHLRQQLGRENEAVIPTELFDELIRNGTDITIWVTKVVINDRQRTNFNFIKPLPAATVNTDIVKDDLK